MNYKKTIIFIIGLLGIFLWMNEASSLQVQLLCSSSRSRCMESVSFPKNLGDLDRNKEHHIVLIGPYVNKLGEDLILFSRFVKRLLNTFPRAILKIAIDFPEILELDGSLQPAIEDNRLLFIHSSLPSSEGECIPRIALQKKTMESLCSLRHEVMWCDVLIDMYLTRSALRSVYRKELMERKPYVVSGLRITTIGNDLKNTEMIQPVFYDFKHQKQYPIAVLQSGNLHESMDKICNALGLVELSLSNGYFMKLTKADRRRARKYVQKQLNDYMISYDPFKPIIFLNVWAKTQFIKSVEFFDKWREILMRLSKIKNAYIVISLGDQETARSYYEATREYLEQGCFLSDEKQYTYEFVSMLQYTAPRGFSKNIIFLSQPDPFSEHDRVEKLKEFIQMIGISDIVITPDTGTMQLAYFFNKKLIVVGDDPEKYYDERISSLEEQLIKKLQQGVSDCMEEFGNIHWYKEKKQFAMALQERWQAKSIQNILNVKEGSLAKAYETFLMRFTELKQLIDAERDDISDGEIEKLNAIFYSTESFSSFIRKFVFLLKNMFPIHCVKLVSYCNQKNPIILAQLGEEENNGLSFSQTCSFHVAPDEQFDFVVYFEEGVGFDDNIHHFESFLKECVKILKSGLRKHFCFNRLQGIDIQQYCAGEKFIASKMFHRPLQGILLLHNLSPELLCPAKVDKKSSLISLRKFFNERNIACDGMYPCIAIDTSEIPENLLDEKMQSIVFFVCSFRKTCCIVCCDTIEREARIREWLKSCRGAIVLFSVKSCEQEELYSTVDYVIRSEDLKKTYYADDSQRIGYADHFRNMITEIRDKRRKLLQKDFDSVYQKIEDEFIEIMRVVTSRECIDQWDIFFIRMFEHIVRVLLESVNIPIQYVSIFYGKHESRRSRDNPIYNAPSTKIAYEQLIGGEKRIFFLVGLEGKIFSQEILRHFKRLHESIARRIQLILHVQKQVSQISSKLQVIHTFDCMA